jgi:hypothetical protein
MTDADDDARYGQHPPRHYYGKYAGLVTDNKPPSSGSHLGQVMVKVPGILEETPDGSSHQPIEVLAAPAFLPGFFFVPEIEAPVWVEFVAGDINTPIWTGVWYPDDATPKAIDAGEPTQPGSAPTLDQKVIRTRSGQVIQLDDTDGSEQLVIKDEKNGNTITCSSTGITIWATGSGGNVTLQFGGGQQPTATVVVQDNTITLTAGDSSSGSSITLDASAGVTLKCGSNNQIVVASDTLTLKTSGVQVKVDSSAMDVS